MDDTHRRGFRIAPGIRMVRIVMLDPDPFRVVVVIEEGGIVFPAGHRGEMVQAQVDDRLGGVGRGLPFRGRRRTEQRGGLVQEHAGLQGHGGTLRGPAGLVFEGKEGDGRIQVLDDEVGHGIHVGEALVKGGVQVIDMVHQDDPAVDGVEHMVVPGAEEKAFALHAVPLVHIVFALGGHAVDILQEQVHPGNVAVEGIPGTPAFLIVPDVGLGGSIFGMGRIGRAVTVLVEEFVHKAGVPDVLGVFAPQSVAAVLGVQIDLRQGKVAPDRLVREGIQRFLVQETRAGTEGQGREGHQYVFEYLFHDRIHFRK